MSTTDHDDDDREDVPMPWEREDDAEDVPMPEDITPYDPAADADDFDPAAEPPIVPGVTVFASAVRPWGERWPLTSVNQLGDLIARLRIAPEKKDCAGFSLAAFAEDRRATQRWRASMGCVVDLDHHGADLHRAPMPKEFADRLAEAARAGKLPGHLYYPTPNGCRCVLLFDRLVEDADRARDLTRRFAGLVRDAMIGLGLYGPRNGLELDTGCIQDIARMFFGPRGAGAIEGKNAPPSDPGLLEAKVPALPAFEQEQEWQRQRSARQGADAPLRAAPKKAKPDKAATPKKPAPESITPVREANNIVQLRAIDGGRKDDDDKPDDKLAQLIDREKAYLAAHPVELSDDRQCPACLHRGCAGFLPNSTTRLSCFSDAHGATGIGIEGDGCWTFDAIDLALAKRKWALDRKNDLLREWQAIEAQPWLGDKAIIDKHAPWSKLTADAEAALASSGRVFSMAGAMAEVDHDGTVAPLTEGALVHALDQVARFVTFGLDETGGVTAQVERINPRGEIPVSLTTLGARSTLPRLRGVTSAPTISASGRIVQRPGYDPEAQLFFAPKVPFPEVPTKPDRAAVDAALARLFAVVAEFPFVDKSSKSAWLSMLLTPVAREMTDGGAPSVLHCVRARSKRTGKTLLVQATSIMATGGLPHVIAPAANEEEQRKELGTAGDRGARFVSFENVAGTFGNTTIADLLTSPGYQTRRLGVNALTRPLRACIAMTSNGASLRDDNAPRAVFVDLDANVERPEARSFSIADLLGFVRREHPALVVDALTIISGWFAAGSPGHGKPPLGGFEAWDRSVRSIVTWATGIDPLPQLEKRDENDEDRSTLEALHEVWAEVFGVWSGQSDPKTWHKDRAPLAADLLRFCLGKWTPEHLKRSGADVDVDQLRTEMQDALQNLQGPGPLDSSRIGKLLRGKKEPVNGRAFEAKKRGTTGAVRWVLRQLG